MRKEFEVLRRPLLTEKSTALKAESRKVVLEAALWANKKQIQTAAEKLFGVEVEKVHTCVMRGKAKRVGQRLGQKSNFKKAILTLSASSDMDVFGTMAMPPVPSEEA